jgi:hypothetical protein
MRGLTIPRLRSIATSSKEEITKKVYLRNTSRASIGRPREWSASDSRKSTCQSFSTLVIPCPILRNVFRTLRQLSRHWRRYLAQFQLSNT